MNIREINLETDHPMLTEWWGKWGWPALPKEMLPSTGYLASWDDKPLMAGWLYMPSENTGIGWFEWAVSNPESTSTERENSLKALTDMIDVVGTSKGLKLIFSSTNSEKFGDRLSRCGFDATDKNVTIYMKHL